MAELNKDKVYNTNIAKLDDLITPEEMRKKYPASDETTNFIIKSRNEIRDILDGKDKRILAVIGPCSIHDKDLALDYAKKLKQLADEVKETILIVMRVYFEKPRTVTGWKGMINDPHINGTFDMTTGLERARELLRNINDMGLPCATEMLDPLVPQYIADLISWAAIGARTTESQTHREMASGLSMPVGFKNATNGDFMVAVNAIESSKNPHSFIGVNQADGKICIFHTAGNDDCHIVLRGGSNGPNYSKQHVEEVKQALAKANAKSGINTKIIIDCNHANSGKDPYKQPEILEEITKQRQAGDDSIIGFMIEGNIEGGNQGIPENLAELKYGVSITDKCLDWNGTEKAILKMHNSLMPEKV
jgi:3-deoxy-7-phosphoheptulonate synthase